MTAVTAVTDTRSLCIRSSELTLSTTVTDTTVTDTAGYVRIVSATATTAAGIRTHDAAIVGAAAATATAAGVAAVGWLAADSGFESQRSDTAFDHVGVHVVVHVVSLVSPT